MTRGTSWILAGWVLALGGVSGAQAQTADTPAVIDEAANSVPDSAPAPAAAEAPIYASREARDMALLAQAVPSDQVVWFDIGGQRVLGLYQAAISASPSGAVLLVQDQDRNPTWPERIQALRLALPKHGWTTLVVTLPPADRQVLPAREALTPPPPVAPDDPEAPNGGTAEVRPETEEVFNDATGDVASVADMNQPQAPDAAPVAPQVPAATQVDQRLAQAVGHLHGKGQFNLALLAEGGGAVRAARLLAAMGGEGFRALVLIDAHHVLGAEAGDVVAMVTTGDRPVLDIQVVDEVALLAAAQARQEAARRAGMTVYQPVQLPAYEPGLARLTKRVRGFLEKHAKGVKVDNAQVMQDPPP